MCKFKKLLKLEKDCVVNEECQSGFCKDKKCSYLSKGESCDGDQQCGKGSYCNDYNDDNVCAEFSIEGGECGNNGYKCQPYLACGTDNKCVKKFSLADGVKTVDDVACKSGISHNINGNNICVNLTVVDECSTKETCTLNYNFDGSSVTKERHCGYKSDGKLACDYSYGSPEMLEYIRLYTEKMGKLDEEDLKEIENYDTLDSKDILKAYVMFNKRLYLLDAEQCVIDYYINKESQGIIALKKILLIGLFALLI